MKSKYVFVIQGGRRSCLVTRDRNIEGHGAKLPLPMCRDKQVVYTFISVVCYLVIYTHDSRFPIETFKSTEQNCDSIFAMAGAPLC